MILREALVDFSDISAQEIQQVINEYVEWRKKIEAEGNFVGAEKLTDEGGKRLSIENETLCITDGSYAEASEVIGGYFTITASDYEEAVEISKVCPHLKYGGAIVLRETETV